MKNKSYLAGMDWIDNFYYGLQSNIPTCCVLWFCNEWTNMRHEKRMFSYSASFEWTRHFQYVPCPECVIKLIAGKKKPNILKKCEYEKPKKKNTK